MRGSSGQGHKDHRKSLKFELPISSPDLVLLPSSNEQRNRDLFSPDVQERVSTRNLTSYVVPQAERTGAQRDRASLADLSRPFNSLCSATFVYSLQSPYGR